MKVCYIAHPGPYFQELAQAVAAEGHEVTFVSFHDKSLPPLFDLARMKGVEAHGIPTSLKWNPARVLPRISAILRSVKPDILHCHYAFPYGMYGMCFPGNRLILSLHGTDAYYRAWRMASNRAHQLDEAGLGHFVFRMAHLALARRIDRIIVGSPDLTVVARELGYGPAKLRRCDIGVDPGFFHPNRRDSKLRKTLLEDFPEGKIVLCARAFKPIYGHRDLLRAMGRVITRFPEVVLVLVEEGLEEESVRRDIRDLGLEQHVKLTGMIPHEEMGRYMCSSDILCSVAYSDTTSLSVLEGMACGLPVLATNVGSIPERLRETGGGILVTPSDIDAIAEGLITLLGSDVICRQMGIRNADYISKNLSFRQTVQCQIQVYEELIAESFV